MAFPFPSSGKGRSNQAGRGVQSKPPPPLRVPVRHSVSIPFKREGVFKEEDDERAAESQSELFQFPSSGKGCSKNTLKMDGDNSPEVSIPFKREGVFKVSLQKGE